MDEIRLEVLGSGCDGDMLEPIIDGLMALGRWVKVGYWGCLEVIEDMIYRYM